MGRKYRGQDKTCARCHKTESVCPGKAMARDCTSDRVLLSTHMEEHWVKVGYKPDTVELNEVDELEIQIGRKDPEPAPSDSLRPDHTAKYTSVMINGFSKTAEEQDIYDILLEGGLPTDYAIENIKKNDKNGQLVIESLDADVCVSLTNHIHGNKFLNREIYVTSAVQKTPAKETLETDAETAICPNGLVESSGSEGSDDSEDEAATVEKPPCTKLFSKISEPVKRPAVASPEVSSEKHKKDKKKKKENVPSTVRSSSRQGKSRNKE